MTMLTVLAVDDEAPARDELAFLLGEHPAVGQVQTAADATEALRALAERRFDAAFLDISMPGLSGMELAAVLSRYVEPPAIVFVTAHDDRALQAYEVGAVDYILKPLREARLAQAVDRVVALRSGTPAADTEPADDDELAPHTGAPNSASTESADTDSSQAAGEVIPVERGGVTALIRRDSVAWVEAVGDYARLHTDSGDYLVRMTLSTLESHWAKAGFARVHRSYLVALPLVGGLRSDGGATKVLVRAHGASAAVELPVSRRQVRELKDRLVRDPLRSFRAGRGEQPGEPGAR